jgi:hypothetical protein
MGHLLGHVSRKEVHTFAGELMRHYFKNSKLAFNFIGKTVAIDNVPLFPCYCFPVIN